MSTHPLKSGERIRLSTEKNLSHKKENTKRMRNWDLRQGMIMKVILDRPRAINRATTWYR